MRRERHRETTRSVVRLAFSIRSVIRKELVSSDPSHRIAVDTYLRVLREREACILPEREVGICEQWSVQPESIQRRQDLSLTGVRRDVIVDVLRSGVIGGITANVRLTFPLVHPDVVEPQVRGERKSRGIDGLEALWKRKPR